MTETREKVAINGKKVAKDQKLKGPFIMTGGFSGLVASIFDAQVAPYRTYSIAPAEP